VLDLTGSTAAIALMSILVALPVTVRRSRRLGRPRPPSDLIASDNLRAVVVLGIAFAAVQRAFLLFASPACGRSSAPSSRRRMAMIPRVVGRPARRQLAGAGHEDGRERHRAAVTGVIAATAGSWPVLVVDAGTFLVSVVLVIGVGRGSAADAVAAARRPRAWAARSPTACGSSATAAPSSPRSAACPS
jgi:hypothetical protein